MSLLMILVILGVVIIAGVIIFALSKPPVISGFDQSDGAQVSKGLLTSKTFWGAVITLVVAVGSALGWDVDEVTLTKVVEAGFLIVTTVLTIVGRKKAKLPIDGLVGRR